MTNINDACELYIQYKMLAGCSKNTIRLYRFYQSNFSNYFGNKDITDFTIQDVYEYRKYISDKVCFNSQAEYIGFLKTILKWSDSNICACPVAGKIPYIKYIRKERHFLSANQVDLMINSTSSVKNKAIISLLYSSGIRVSELIALNRSDIHGNYFYVLGKGGKSRICFIDNRTRALLNLYLKTRKDNYKALFTTFYGNRIADSNLRLMLARISKRCDFPFVVSPHIIRHSFATNFINNNGNIRHLADMLGHSSINTTMIYTHTTNPELFKSYNKYHTTN